MSLLHARQELQWQVVMSALAEAEADAETIKLVESARDAHRVFHSMTSMLLSTADATKPKNYVKFEITGLVAPFERAYVELCRPGGKTSHELRELMRDRLHHVRHLLISGPPTDALREGMIEGINETLAVEAP